MNSIEHWQKLDISYVSRVQKNTPYLCKDPLLGDKVWHKKSLFKVAHFLQLNYLIIFLFITMHEESIVCLDKMLLIVYQEKKKVYLEIGKDIPSPPPELYLSYIKLDNVLFVLQFPLFLFLMFIFHLHVVFTLFYIFSCFFFFLSVISRILKLISGFLHRYTIHILD